jgi:hypothetical protein
MFHEGFQYLMERGLAGEHAKMVGLGESFGCEPDEEWFREMPRSWAEAGVTVEAIRAALEASKVEDEAEKQAFFTLPLFAPLFEIATSSTILRAVACEWREEGGVLRAPALREEVGKMRLPVAGLLRDTTNIHYLVDLVAIDALLGT